MIRNFIKQKLKTLLNKLILPAIYNVYRFKRVQPRKVIFADSNTDELPYSMKPMYDRLKSEGYDIRVFVKDFRKCGILSMMNFMASFMKEYASAGCIFICNYFVPVTSCSKRKETQVVQLWHSCGLLKKFAYDAEEDLSAYYHGSVTKNITLITVSSQACISVWQNALRLSVNEKGIVRATGVSRTDMFFDENFIMQCKEEFFAKYPERRGKKIILFAPTFRGTAGDAKTVGANEILELSERLGRDWSVIIKLHPHSKEKISNCDMPTYKLFACADLLISDYSSLIFEFAFFKKPIVIFAPDLDSYNQKRGMYIDPEEIAGEIAINVDHLEKLVKERYAESINPSLEYYKAFDKLIQKHCGACDGHCTDRIAHMVFGKLSDQNN